MTQEEKYEDARQKAYDAQKAIEKLTYQNKERLARELFGATVANYLLEQHLKNKW